MFDEFNAIYNMYILVVNQFAVYNLCNTFLSMKKEDD